MPNPTISIVTTVYDAKDYIPRTVRSILAQSFTDFELLLVEDGSPNGCGELCDEFAKTDPRIRVFHKENGGPASALNVGLDNARGDYIGFVDSDDLVDPDLYETLLNAIRENDVRIASCNADAVDEQEKPVPGAGVNINIAGRHMAMELLLDTFKTGGFYGLRLSSTRAACARAILEAAAFQLRDFLNMLSALGCTAQTVTSLGGGAGSALWMQIKADACRRPFHTLSTVQATSRGAAMLAAGALGWALHDAEEQTVYQPQAETADAYEEAYAAYRRVYEALYLQKG